MITARISLTPGANYRRHAAMMQQLYLCDHRVQKHRQEGHSTTEQRGAEDPENHRPHPFATAQKGDHRRRYDVATAQYPGDREKLYKPQQRGLGGAKKALVPPYAVENDHKHEEERDKDVEAKQHSENGRVPQEIRKP